MQPELLLAVLAVLPPRIASIKLATNCTGPVLAALSRFKLLRTLHLGGNAAFVNWQGRGAAAQVPKLRQLRLDCREPQREGSAPSAQYPDPNWPPSRLDSHMPSTLAAATALSSLELVLDWTQDVAALCRGLPALRSLMWVGRGWPRNDSGR